MYFTGAGESIRLRVQDGRVAARCGAAWRVWATLHITSGVGGLLC